MRRLLILGCTIVLVDTVFFAALAPLVPHYAEEFGLSELAIGIVNGAYGAGIIAGAVPAALLTVRAGVRPTAAAGLAILAATSFLFGLADDAMSLTLLRFGGGFGSACSWIAAFTWVISVARGDRRGQMIGTLVSAGVIGALLGPVLGSAAAGFGITPAFAVVALVALATAGAVTLEPPPARPERWTWSALPMAARPRPAASLFLIGLSPLLFSTLVVLAPLELSRLGWGAAGIGAVFLLGAVFEAIAHPVTGRWSDRIGYRIPISLSLALSVGLLLALPLAANPWWLGGLVALSAGIFNLALTPGTALFTQSFDQLGGGPALGFALTNVAWAGGFAAGAPIGGFLSGLGGDLLPYATLAALCVLTLIAIRRVV